MTRTSPSGAVGQLWASHSASGLLATLATVEIGQQYGPFDMCAIPIGSYTPRWMLKPMHVNPADAVQIHQVWVTFLLGFCN